jgi:glycosyltransferase involved in cell wall biosynthesis
MRVLRVYHGGRDPAHRMRERALADLGVDVTLVVPTSWPDGGAEATLGEEPFRIVELDVRRPGDVNRHRYAEDRQVRAVLDEVRPHLLDLHEEPVALVTRQWLRASAGEPALPVALYTAQNIDKRFPPPFAQYERSALHRAAALYPCSRQAASVARGKGFGGRMEVLPLGYDPDIYRPGAQTVDDPVLVLGLVGRMVPEKGVRDAVQVLAAVRRHRRARLLLIGSGPEIGPATALAAQLGVGDDVEVCPWVGAEELGRLYAGMHVLLVPSRATRTWVEQFGRVIVEAQASGAVVAGYTSGSIPEVAGDAGLLVGEGDAEVLAQRVCDLLRRPVELERRRQAGLSLAAGRTWSEVARQQADLYRCVCSGTLPPAPVGRAPAAVEFGAPARIAGASRPFALPVLRHDTPLSRALGAGLDLVSRRPRTPSG